MAGFDVTGSVSFGYRFVWSERRYLLYLAAVPLLIKFICNMTIIMLGWRTEFIRQALILLPSYFADGWMLSHLVRLVFLGQRWPFRPGGNRDMDMNMLQDRARGIMAGTVSFAVIEFLLAGFVDAVYGLGAATFQEGRTQDPTFMTSMSITLVMLLFILMFRFLWFFIPAAINYSLSRYARDTAGFRDSMRMVAAWLLCFVPTFFFFSFFLAPAFLGGEKTVTKDFIEGFLTVTLDTIIALIATAGMAYGIRGMMPPDMRGGGPATV